MRKKMLVIVGNYLIPSSVSINLRPYLEALKSEGYQIDIITNSNNKEIIKDDIAIIYTTTDMLSSAIEKIENKKSLLFPKKILVKLINFFIYKILNKFTLESRYLGWSTRRTVDLCRELHVINEYEQVLSVTLPFKSNKIAYEFVKDLEIDWKIFSFDPFSFNSVENNNFFKKRLSRVREKKYFEYCNKLLLTPELFLFYKNTHYNYLSNKFIEIPYATLKYIEKSKETLIELKGEIVCLYSGRLYQDIRNPKDMLDTFKYLNNFDLYIITDFNEINFNRTVDMFQNIHKLPMGTYEYGLSAVSTADILINIGNTVSYQVPGKIFELMGTGKPIIHFSRDRNDESIKYLTKYPLSLIVYADKLKITDNLKLIENLCYQNKGKLLTKQEIKDSMDKYYSDMAIEKFKKIYFPDWSDSTE